MTDQETLAACVEKLERQSRIWACLCLLSLVAVPLFTAAGSKRRVEAQGFVLGIFTGDGELR